MAKTINTTLGLDEGMDSKFGAFVFLGAVLFIVGLIFANAQVTSAATPIEDGCNIIVSQLYSTGGIIPIGCSAGTFPPGTVCTSDNDCSLGSCDCKLGNLPGNVCCSRDTGHACQGNDECATKVCNNGVCANTPAGNPKLANGDRCRTNQECTSGKCELRSPTKPYYVCKQ